MKARSYIKIKDEPKIETGSVLVAKPFGNLEIFDRVVIMILEHNSHGTTGILLNRQSNLMISDALSFLKFNKPLYYGGPSDTKIISYVHSNKSLPDSISLGNGLFWGGSFDVLSDLIEDRGIDLSELNFFAGFIHWKSGQLVEEINGNRSTIKNDSAINKSALGLFRIIKKNYQSLFIEKIVFNEIKFKYLLHDDSISVLSIDDGNLSINNFIVDSTLNNNDSRFFRSEGFDLNLKEISYILKDCLYTITSSHLSASYSDNNITIDSFIVRPNYDKYEFGKKAGKQIDRMDLYCEEIVLNNYDTKEMFESGKINIHHLLINIMNLHAFRDKHIKFFSEKKQFVQSLLRLAPFKFNIDSLSVKDGNVIYEERNIQSSNPGRISFNRINAVISKMTNMNLNQVDSLTVYASAYLNDKGKIKMHLIFPLVDDTTSFYCRGSMSKMEMKDLNSMMKNNAFLYFTNGVIDSLKFQFKAGKDYSTGEMLFVYHDLRIALKEKEENDTTEIKEKVMSFFANTFALNQDNPKKNKAVEKVNLYYYRNPNKFIFNYSWKTILSGIKKTIRLPEKE